MTIEQKQSMLAEIADEIGGNVRNSYSGRAMYGKTCMGITCPNITACIETAALKGITGARTDNMGLQFIVYWPSIPAKE